MRCPECDYNYDEDYEFCAYCYMCAGCCMCPEEEREEEPAEDAPGSPSFSFTRQGIVNSIPPDPGVLATQAELIAEVQATRQAASLNSIPPPLIQAEPPLPKRNKGLYKSCRVCKKAHDERGICIFCGRCRIGLKVAGGCTCGTHKGQRMPNALGEIDRKVKLFTKSNAGGLVGGKAINVLSRPLGLEVELSEWGGFDMNWKPRNFQWTQAHDGSVEPSGFELVLSPMSGDGFVAGVVELGEELAEAGATVNETCGLHVHVDASDYSYWDLRRLIRLYTMMENDIYRVLVEKGRENAQSRHGWLFCGKVGTAPENQKYIQELEYAKSTQGVKSVIQEMVYGVNSCPIKALKAPGTNTKAWRRVQKIFRDTQIQNTGEYLSMRKQKYGGSRGSKGFQSRYLGLNIHSWFHRGTIEWRMKEGTLDLKEMLCWALFCGWFVELVQRMNDRFVVPRLTDNGGERLPRRWELLEFIKTNMPQFIYNWAADRKLEG